MKGWKDWIYLISVCCICISICLVKKQLSDRITYLEQSIIQLEQTEFWCPEPWMFQPATEECDPDEHWRCWE